MCKHKAPEDEEDHPENPFRIRAIWDQLQASGLAQRCVVLNAKEADDNQLALVHSQEHIDFIKTVSSTNTGPRSEEIAAEYDSVYFNGDSSEAANLAAGSVIEAAVKVARGELDSAFAIVRPPGHHAEKDEPMGFCLYNNVAVAASFLLNERPELGISKILIVDWDVHHGNSTQKMFYKDPRVLFFSVHRHENGSFYPGGDDGSHVMTGEGTGAGYNINVPWGNGCCGDSDYIAVWDHILIPVVKKFDPDMIIISVGFDAALGDPIGGCLVSPYGYSVMLDKLMDFASGKIVMALEGGYNPVSLANSVQACIEVLLRERPHIRSFESLPLKSTWLVIQEVRELLSAYWPVLAAKLPDELVKRRISQFEVNLGISQATHDNKNASTYLQSKTKVGQSHSTLRKEHIKDYEESDADLSVDDQGTGSNDETDEDFIDQPKKSKKRCLKQQAVGIRSTRQRTIEVAKVETSKAKSKASASKTKHTKDVVDHTKIRISPKLLTEAVSHLTKPQEEWVRASGFGLLLDFRIRVLPHKLGFKIAHAFNPGNFRITLATGNITVKEEDVAEVLGFPHGENQIDLEGRNSVMVENWSAQWGLDKSKRFKVTPSMVLKALLDEREVTELFKMNFLIILYNCLIESPSTSFVNKKMLNFIGDLDRLATCNWPKLVMERLADTNDAWAKDPVKKCYTGPLLFLIVLYVDRVNYKGQRKVARAIPTWLTWTDVALRQKSAMEIEEGTFGKGVLSKGQWQELAGQRNRVVQSIEAPTAQPSSIVDRETGESSKKRSTIEEDMMKKLERAAFDVIVSLSTYSGLMRTCFAINPNNPRLREIEKMVLDSLSKVYRIPPDSEQEASFVGADPSSPVQQESTEHSSLIN